MAEERHSAAEVKQRIEAEHVTVNGKNGEPYLLRPIRPSDAPSLMRGYDALSDESKWFRMLHAVPHLSESMAKEFCSPDPERDICLVIEGRGVLTGEILGGARIAGREKSDSVEFSVSLRPEAQGLGLARQALEATLAAAAEMGYRSVWGTISVRNKPMLGLAERMGFSLRSDPDDRSLMLAERTL